MSAPTPAAAKRLSSAGLIARIGVAAAILLGVLLLPLLFEDFRNFQITRAVIYAVIGLSMNVLMGHAGQISLGHQAFVGLGAFVSGFVATEMGAGFYVALPVAGLFGALSAGILGLVALRLRGLYLALITLAYGLVAEASLFNLRAFTGGGEGLAAQRPAAFASERAYMYLCLAILALVLSIDWRLMKTKAGRAILVIRHDERVASTLGVNVVFYKILAFMMSGFIAGIAGSLFAHWQQGVVANDFLFEVALIWVFMTVVGGLGSRAGVVVGSAFFALFPLLVEELLAEPVAHIFGIPQEQFLEKMTRSVPLIGALLILLTLTKFPGGIGQQLMPLRRWLAGGPFLVHKKRPEPSVEARPEGKKAKGKRKALWRRRSHPAASPTQTQAETADAAAAHTPLGDTAEMGPVSRAGQPPPAGDGDDAETAETTPVVTDGQQDGTPHEGPAGTPARRRLSLRRRKRS